MPIYKVKELWKKDEKELKKILEELREELMKLKMKIEAGMELENPSRYRIVRRTIARVLTILNSKKAK